MEGRKVTLQDMITKENNPPTRQTPPSLTEGARGGPFIVIGITDNPQPWFPPEVMEIIRNGKVFSGGKRHHEIVAPLLPEGAQWIDITVPLESVFKKYRGLSPDPSPVREGRMDTMACGKTPLPNRGGDGGEAFIVFASGDPLFFGFANTLRREFPDAEIQVFPTFNSLQMLSHRLLMPYHDMRIVSLTGRPWQEFERALIERATKIGVLTDKEHTPAAIAQRMLEYGYTHYQMYVGEHLGNPEKERVTTLSLKEAAEREFAMPNCVILDSPPALPVREGAVTFEDESFQPSKHSAPSLTGCQEGRTECSGWTGSGGESALFGLPDSSFALLNGREKMITKMPIRLLTLQTLDLPQKHVFWDIGFCTGSVSIEARLQFPHLQIEAFEIRPECETIIHENARRFGAPGINVHIGDFLETDITALPRPDAVFIGGHGGQLKELMTKVVSVLAPDGVIVMNSVKAPLVKTDSHHLWDEACAELGLKQEPPTRILLDDHHPIVILKAQKQ